MQNDSLNATYLKSKRYLIFFSAVLVLTSVVGLAPKESSNLLGWSIGNPEYTSAVLYFIVIYYLGQLALFWNVQGHQIRELAQHSFDYWMSVFIATCALYSLPLALFFDGFLNNRIETNSTEVTESFSAWFIGILFLLPILCLICYLFIFKKALWKSRDAQATREADILNVLTTSAWTLVFNPELYSKSNGTKGSKEIEFLENGDIGEGRNSHESTWRLTAGFLEILNDTNNIYSRFRYDSEEFIFRHTNDDDTISIRNQYIILKESGDC